MSITVLLAVVGGLVAVVGGAVVVYLILAGNDDKDG
jgi:hypothetical protein